eukprot:925381_1
MLLLSVSLIFASNFALEIIASASGHHTCALFTPNALKCFGYNAYGALGYGDTNNRGDEPNEMGENLTIIDLGTDFRVVQVATGGRHTCALSEAGTVKCWGFGHRGQLGHENTTNRGSSANQMGDDLFVVDLGTNFKATQITLGLYYSCALSDSNEVKCFGENTLGQLGQGDVIFRGDVPGEMGDNLLPIELGTNFTPVEIVAGDGSTCGLSQFGTVKCWGWNSAGMLGYGDSINRGDMSNQMGDALQEIDLGTNFNVTQISVGMSHTCALSDANVVKCFGDNSYGQLGYEDLDHRGDNPNEMGDNLPAVDLGTNLKVVHLITRRHRTCVLLDSMKMKCFGRNRWGELGLGNINVGGSIGGQPNQMGDNLLYVDLGTDFNIAQIVAGELYTCALSSSNALKCFGENQYGQLGQGDAFDRGGESNQMGDALQEIDIGFISIPTQESTNNPTNLPSIDPTKTPTKVPTKIPTQTPTKTPTKIPANIPTKTATKTPAKTPTKMPTKTATDDPITITTQTTFIESESPMKTQSNAPTIDVTTPPTLTTEQLQYDTTDQTVSQSITDVDSVASSDLSPYIWMGAIGGVLLIVIILARCCHMEKKKTIQKEMASAVIADNNNDNIENVIDFERTTGTAAEGEKKKHRKKYEFTTTKTKAAKEMETVEGANDELEGGQAVIRANRNSDELSLSDHQQQSEGQGVNSVVVSGTTKGQTNVQQTNIADV